MKIFFINQLLKFSLFINKRPKIKLTTIKAAKIIAHILSVDKNARANIAHIGNHHGIEFALGYTYWLFTLKYNIPTPKYNIYHLIPKKNRQLMLTLLKKYPTNSRAKKQIMMLTSHEVTQDTIRQAKSILCNILTKDGNKEMDQKKSLEALIETKLKLEQLGTKPFAVSGTALGLIREGRILRHDYDIDLGIFEGEIEIETLQRNILTWKFIIYVELSEHLIRIKHKNNITIDLFIHYRENGKIWHGSKTHRWYNTDFGITKLNIENDYIYVPDNPDKYLTENYGNWRKPPLFWDYSFDTPNRIYPKTNNAMLYLLNRIEDEMNKSQPDRYTVEKCMESLEKYFSVKSK